MNINVGSNADSIIAGNFPRFYMAITALKIIFVLIIIFVVYRLKTSDARYMATQEVNRTINLRNEQRKKLAAENPGKQITEKMISASMY